MPIEDPAAPFHAQPHSLGLELLVAASECPELERCHELINQFLARQQMPPADGPHPPPTALHAISDPHVQDILHQFLIEGATEGIWVVDRYWRTTYVNPAMAQMLDFAPAEMLGRPISAFMDAEGALLADEFMARREQGIQETHEFQFVNRMGGKVWTLVITVPLLDRAGAFAGSAALIVDVTEQKLAERTLLKQQSLMQYAEQVGGIGSWEWDSKHRQLTLSPGFLRIHGIDDSCPADVQDPWAFVLPDDRAAMQKLLEDTKLGGGPFVVEHRSVRHNDGQIRHLRTQGSALYDAGGNYVGFIGVSQDVTDRKRAEQELKESEERLRFALDATSEGVWDWDLWTGKVLFSDHWLRQLGYTHDTFPAHVDAWRSIVHPDDRLLVESVLQEHFDGHTVAYECENRLRTSTGAYRYNLDRGKVVEWNPDGTPRRMVGVDLDITQRKQAEYAQAQLAAIVESSHDAIVGQDLEGRITSWNHGAERLYGYKAAEVIGEDVVSLLPAQGKPELQELIAQVRSGEPMKSIDTICIGKDGKALDVSLTVSPVKDGKGAVIGISTSARDIADRKRIEAELRQSERQYRLLAENMLDVVWVMDVESGRFTYVSPSVERLRGYTVDEVMAQSAMEAITPESQARLVAAMANDIPLFLGGRPIQAKTTEIEQPCRDGTTVWTDVVGRYYVDPESGKLLVYGVTRNATERRHREDEIRQLNATLEVRVHERTAQLESAILALQRAERMKDEFLSTVSHELRTPLTGVLGMADALEMQVSGQLNERQLRYVRQIRESGDRLLATVNSILSYAELLADTAPIQVEPCRLLELGALSLRSVRARAEARQLKLSLQIEPDDLEILSDASGIVQILQRLVDNAVKFTPERGSIGLKFTRDQEVVYLTVWDTGIGIEPDDQERIFRPFVQLDGGLGRRYEGVGLGLAYAYQMVSRLGGRIEVESAVGEGSRFTVTLPSDPAASAIAGSGFLGTACC